MKIVHVSDRHYGQPNAVGKNATVNNAIANRPDACDLILIDTGDQVETPDAGIYATAEAAQRELAQTVREMVVVPGNHDLIVHGFLPTDEQMTMWGCHSIALTGRSICPQVVTVENVAIIGLDSNRRHPSGLPRFMAQGHLDTEQIETCAALVEAFSGQGYHTVVALHHCPIGGEPTLRLSDRDELGAALEAVGGVDLMLAGHLHRAGEWRDAYGADWLISSPKTPAAQKYREIWWEGGELNYRWVEC